MRPLAPPSWLSPLRLALVLTVFDGAWAWQALSASTVTAVSNVELISVIVWSFFHLPAALVANAILQALGQLPKDPQALPLAAWALLLSLGLAQTFALSYGLRRWWLAKKDS